MAGRTRRGRSERDEELESVREELREVRRELREIAQSMRGQGSERSGGTQGQEDSDHLHRRSRSERPIISQMEAMKRFMVMQPPSFNGEPNAEAAEHWLRRIKRILVGLDIPEERRVSLAAYMLVDKADFWWESMKIVYDIEVMTWEEFERIFLGKYFGEVAKHAKRMEFEHLIQGTMSVLEYESRFSELSKFALGMINEEGEKARRFQQGLRLAIRNRLVPLAIRDYSELVKRALLVEQDIEETNQIREQRGNRKVKQRMGESSQRRSQGSQQRQRSQQFEGHSSFYARGEQSAQRAATARVCYGCGTGDHLWRACPLRGAQQTRPQSQGGSQQQSVVPFQPPQFQLSYYQTPHLPLAVQGARTTTMSSQTHSSQGSNARGRGRQAAGRGFALTPTEPEEDFLLVEGAYKSPNEKGHRDCKKPKARSCPTSRSEVEILSSSNLKAFSFSELKSATNNFRLESLLGEGGFGFVYKGCIDADTLGAARPGSAMDVAVKKLIPAGFQGHKEWLAEVNFLGQLQHPNLVKLLGYCLEGEDRLLVYEFMARGSLENHLFRRTVPPLSWETRIKVAVGAARGLAVLHNSQPEIIYRDFKASNILLDSEFNAKLSDFGLAKEGPTGDRTHVSTQVFGTQGYAAPEYIATGHLTTRCDIYSFGVVLLEILSGRRAIDKTKPRAEEKLVSWARPYLNDKKMFYRIMDSRMEGGYPKTGAYIASTLALQCVCHAKNRPTMSEVVKILERILAATDTAGPSQSAQQSVPSPVGRSTVGSSNPSPLPLSPAESPSPAHSPQPPQQLG